MISGKIAWSRLLKQGCEFLKTIAVGSNWNSLKPKCLIVTIGTLFLFSLSEAPGFSFTGEVIGVLDGDTIEVLHNKKTQRVRLYGIDCPEKGQAFGNNAKQATSALVFAQVVTLEIHGKDKYGRVLADVLLADGTNVNHTLVKDGWCWWYRKFAPDDTTLETLETEAIETGRGLWADPEPVPPWAWRKRGKSVVVP